MVALNSELLAGADRLPELTADEVETYGWQLPVGGFGELAQRRLKGASVLCPAWVVSGAWWPLNWRRPESGD